MTVSQTFLLAFTPDHWSAVRRFQLFIGPPFTDREIEKGARSTASHLAKFEIMAALARRLAPGLIEDQIELDRDGHSPAVRSREFAALIETLICELYAALEGVRRVLFGAYRNVEGVQNTSTERLFKRAANNSYGPQFPEALRTVLDAAYTSWFPYLRRFRTELTHGDVGYCTLNRETGNVRYIHGGLGTTSRAMVIDDVLAGVDEHAVRVTGLVEAVFGYLYTQLQQVQKQIPCGMFKGRIYERIVAPEANLTFASGECFSKAWFEREPGLECPMRARCGAYEKSR